MKDTVQYCDAAMVPTAVSLPAYWRLCLLKEYSDSQVPDAAPRTEGL